MTDVYASPQSDLNVPPTITAYGSVEKGLAGQYDFRIGEIISEAWQKTNGVKGSFLLAFVIYFAIAIAIGAVFGLLSLGLYGVWSPEQAGHFHLGFFLVKQLVTLLITLPLAMGLFMMGVRRAVDAPVQATMIFRYYGKSLTLLGAVILIELLMLIGFVLLVIPGIYLAFAYYFSLPLIIDKDMPIWRAMETSRKAISKKWFRFAGLGLLLGVIMLLSMIPLLIPLIWVAPMVVIALGIAYRNMFGCEASSLA